MGKRDELVCGDEGIRYLGKDCFATCKSCLATFIKIDSDYCTHCERVRARSKREGQIVMI